LYGHFGVGKTPLIGSGERTMIMDADNGLESAKAAGSKAEFAEVKGYDDLAEMYDYFKYGSGCADYDWVWLDSLSMFMDRSLIDDLVAEAHARKPATISADYADRPQYMIQQNRISKFCREWRALPINFGVTALVMIEEDSDGELRHMPLIPGKHGQFSQKMCGYFNLVTYMLIKDDNKTRRLLTETKNEYHARDRFHAVRTPLKAGGTAGWIDNPSVPKVERLIKEKLASGQDQAEGKRRPGRGRRTVR
jgi:hypothetical protein